MWILGYCSRCGAMVVILPKFAPSLSLMQKSGKKFYCSDCYVGELSRIRIVSLRRLEQEIEELKLQILLERRDGK